MAKAAYNRKHLVGLGLQLQMVGHSHLNHHVWNSQVPLSLLLGGEFEAVVPLYSQMYA